MITFLSSQPCDIIHNVTDICLAPTTATKSKIPLLPISCFLAQCSLCPLVYSQRCARIGRYHRHPCLANPLHPTPTSNPPAPPHPCLLLHMQRKEASPLWQQQNTTLQKRCAPLTVTIKKGVDRIRAEDDDLRGRDVQKEARREEKRAFFPLSLFFSYLFFIFSGFIKPHLTHV